MLEVIGVSKSAERPEAGQWPREGCRCIELWVPDTTHPGFAAEARRQSAVVAAADAMDNELPSFMDEALMDEFGGNRGDE